MIKGKFHVGASILREGAVDYYLDIEDAGTADDLALLLGSTERHHNVIVVPENFQAMVKAIYVNDEKRTVTAVFYDGKVVTKKAADDCIFDVNTGVALCIASYVCGSSAKFHQLVERKVKSSVKTEAVKKTVATVSEEKATFNYSINGSEVKTAIGGMAGTEDPNLNEGK